MSKPKIIQLIRTYYPHWNQHSGINQFIKYVDPNTLQFREYLVSRSRSRFGVIRFAKRKISDIIRLRGPRSYQLNDFLAEIIAFYNFLRCRYDVLFYLDGEHSLNFLPTWLHGINKVGLGKIPKIIVMFHQPPERLNRVVSSLVKRDLIKLIDQIIVLSEVQAMYFAKYIPEDKLTTILHGVDTDYFRPEKLLEEKKFKCLSVGYHLRDYKTVWEVAELLKEYANIEFHVVSSEIELPEKKNIYVHSNIPDKRLLSLYQAADILFLPLLDATANNVILEALSCGLPIITSRLPGTIEYLNGNESVFVPNGDKAAFVESIVRLYQNREKVREMGALARQRAIELSWPRFAAKIEKVILN